MELYVALRIFFVVFFVFTLCGACCRTRSSRRAVIATPIIITSEQHRTPGGVEVQDHATGTAVYPTVAHTGPKLPYPASAPQPATVPPQGQIAPISESDMSPPSYDQVMNAEYAPQAPYNPNFTGGK